MDGASANERPGKRTKAPGKADLPREVRRRKGQACAFEQEVLPILEVTRSEFLAKARACARIHFMRHGTVTVDDVRSSVPPPAGVDGRVMGAVLNRKDWECLHYVKSDRKACHNRPIGVFVLRA